MRRGPSLPLLGLLALMLLACGPASEFELGLEQLAITGGEVHTGHPAVGRLQVGSDQMCTGTLVGPRSVLSAAHCLKDPSIFFVLDSGAVLPAAGAVKHPSHAGDGEPYDIALVTLQNPSDVEPILLATQPPSPGQALTLIGYGTTACRQVMVDGQPTLVCEDDEGVKRLAENTVEEVTDLEFTFTGLGNTCKGDSGGPALSEEAGREVVLGVTSRGDMPCGTKGYDTRVDRFVSWLEEVSGGDVRSDAEPPTVAITEPLAGAQLDSGTIAVRATVEDNSGAVASVELLVDGQPAGRRDLGEPQVTRFDVDLAPGSYQLTVAAADADGNQAEDSVQIEVLVSEDKPLDGQCTGEQCDPATNATPGETTLVGGCAVGSGPAAAWPAVWLLLALPWRRLLVRPTTSSDRP
jgi:hypothetical protein